MAAKKPALVIKPRFLVAAGKRFVFGPGKAELLEHLDRTGSISEAAKAMEMSYMRAWTLVKGMEHGFAEPLVERLRGGATRGGAKLTDTGRKVLKLYRELEAASATATQGVQARLAALLKS